MVYGIKCPSNHVTIKENESDWRVGYKFVIYWFNRLLYGENFELGEV